MLRRSAKPDEQEWIYSCERENHETGQTMAKFVEHARGLEKEMRTKVLPYFVDQAVPSSICGETAEAKALRESQKYWQGIYDQLADIGKRSMRQSKYGGCRSS